MINNLQGYYVRDDGAIISVHMDAANIGGQEHPLVIKDGVVWMGSFWLAHQSEDQLLWDNEDMPTITWRRGDPEDLRPLKSYLDNLAMGNPLPVKEDTDMPMCRSIHTPEPKTPIPRGSTLPTEPKLASSTREPHEMGESHKLVEKPTHQVPRLSASCFGSGSNQLRPQDVNEMSVPKLKEADMLASHLGHLENLAIDIGIISTGPLGPKMAPKLGIAFSLKVLESLTSVPDVHSTFQQNMELLEYDFWLIKEVLLRAFCTPNKLRNSIRSRLSTLKPLSVHRPDHFITACSTILCIVTSLPGEHVVEYVQAVTAIFAKLPDNIRRSIHAKLFVMAGDDRWELALPFDLSTSRWNVFARKPHTTTVDELIRQNCEIQQGLEEIMPISVKTDRVNKINDTSAEEFVAPFRCAFVAFLTAKGSLNKCEAQLQADGFEVRRYLSRKQNPYFVIATNMDPSEAESRLQKLTDIGLNHREFEVRKNARSDSQPASPTQPETVP